MRTVNNSMKHLKLFEAWTNEDDALLDLVRLGLIEDPVLKKIIDYYDSGSTGTLFAGGYPLTHLPPFLKKLPKDLHLGESLIETLPDGMEINGSLYLNGAKNLKTLPVDLTVAKDLVINATNIKDLPVGLRVGRSLYMYDTPFSYSGKSLDDIRKDLEEKGGNAAQIYF